jgi:uncharacterized protein
MLLKLIILGVVIYGIYRLLGGSFKLTKRDGDSTKGLDGDTLVECDRCSVYVTKREAIEHRGKFYCSKECLPD